MYILGINVSHDASTCLIKDGEIVFYREFERISKFKNSIIQCEKEVFRKLKPFIFYHIENIKEHTNFIDHIIFASFGDETYDGQAISSVHEQLKSSGIEWGNSFFNSYDHHLYHASNAAFSSGFEECVCLIIDGTGSRFDSSLFREIESIYSFNYSEKLKPRFKHYSRVGNGFYKDFKIEQKDECTTIFSDSLSCGILFNMFSKSMGYRWGIDAGKIMGLSSYGERVDTYGNWHTKIFDIEVTNNNVIIALSKIIEDLQPQEQRNVLRTLQEETKDHTIHLIKKALKMCKTNNIVLSGGYFLNCVNNYYYLKEFPEVNFYVDPIAHDGGTSIGAAKYLWHHLTGDKTIRKLNTLYL